MNEFHAAVFNGLNFKYNIENIFYDVEIYLFLRLIMLKTNVEKKTRLTKND